MQKWRQGELLPNGRNSAQDLTKVAFGSTWEAVHDSALTVIERITHLATKSANSTYGEALSCSFNSSNQSRCNTILWCAIIFRIPRICNNCLIGLQSHVVASVELWSSANVNIKSQLLASKDAANILLLQVSKLQWFLPIAKLSLGSNNACATRYLYSFWNTNPSALDAPLKHTKCITSLRGR